MRPDVDELGTDPRTPPPTVRLPEIPGIVGHARIACGEVGIACGDLLRSIEGTPLAPQARRLRVLATRLGQVATALSAMPLRGAQGAPVEVLVWVAPGLLWWRRVRWACVAFWRVIRGPA